MVEQKKKSIFKTYMIYFIAMVLFCVVRIMANTDWLSNVGNVWSDIIYTGIIQVVVMFLIPFLMYMLFINVPPKSVFKTVNFSKINFSTVLVSIGLGVVIFLMNIVVSSIFSGIIGFTGYRTPLTFETQPTPDWGITSFLLNVLLVAVLPAICEEFLHRGLLLQGTKHIGFTKSIIISSVLFGLIHFNIAQVSYAIVLGLVLGFASVVAKNLWVPIIMHFVNNFIAVYLDFAEANGWLLGDYNVWLQKLAGMDFWIVCLICFIALSIIALLLFYFIMILFRQSILKKVNKAIQKVYSKDQNLTDEPVLINKGKVIHEMLENNTMINLNYEEMKSPFEIVMPKQKIVYTPNFKDNIFLICSFVLGGLITLFTFVWGFI
jgi:membrane protease YdiL (CAAX protease family)